jgi:hypothetical protein
LNGDALSAPFTITNSGAFFTLADVESSCVILHTSYSGGLTIAGPQFRRYAPVIPELSPGGSDTVYCGADRLIDLGDRTTESADVVIKVKYRSTFFSIPIPFRSREESARFITRSTSDGKVRWTHYGLRDHPDPDLR